MTVQHAWEITDYVMNCECPFTAEKALQFALFRYVAWHIDHIESMTSTHS